MKGSQRRGISFVPFLRYLLKDFLDVGLISDLLMVLVSFRTEEREEEEGGRRGGGSEQGEEGGEGKKSSMSRDGESILVGRVLGVAIKNCSRVELVLS